MQEIFEFSERFLVNVSIIYMHNKQELVKYAGIFDVLKAQTFNFK